MAPILIGMPTYLRDQRVMVGERPHSTPEEVVQGWKDWASTYGFRVRQRFGDYSTDLRESDRVVKAYVSGGNWTGDCPGCNGGIPTWPEAHDRGCCLDCGTIYPIEYPAKAELDAGIAALIARPREKQHWHPHRGETAADLARENEGEGFLPVAPSRASVEKALARELGPERAQTAVALMERDGLL